MLRLTCPGCREDSYSADVESFSECPYCGFIFSGKYGAQKRKEERIKQEIPLAFSYQGEHLKASTLDISENGLGIKIFGEPPVSVEDIIELTIGDLQVRAKVMWVRKLPTESMAGLGKLN